MRTPVNPVPGLLAHCRLRCNGIRSWSAGHLGCCGVWACSTPWGALRGARQRHKIRVHPVTPTPDWINEANVSIARYRAEGFFVPTVREGQPWRQTMADIPGWDGPNLKHLAPAPAEWPVILQMDPALCRRSRFRRSRRPTMTSTGASTGASTGTRFS